MDRSGIIRPRHGRLPLLACCVLLLSAAWMPTMAGAVVPPDSFTDVGPGDDFYLAIETLAEMGVVGGYADGTFRPADSVKRAQFAKMIVGVLGYAVDETMVAPFDDLGTDITVGGPTVDNLYPHEYVAVAAAHGITRGVRERAFSPYTSVTRAQMVTMTVRAAQAEGVPLDPSTDGVPSNLIPGWFGSPEHFDNLVIAENNGLLHGLGESGVEWDPWQPAGRGECAQVLYNLSRLMDEDEDYLAAEDLIGGNTEALAEIDYAWVTSGGPRLRLNFKQLLTGPTAAAVAAADGLTLDGDYYIRDQNPRYWTVDVAPSVVIHAVYDPYPMEGQAISWGTFDSYRQPWRSWWITWRGDMTVYDMFELWVP